MRKVHAANPKTFQAYSGVAKTYCGLETGRVLGVPFGARTAGCIGDVTCKTCLRRGLERFRGRS